MTVNPNAHGIYPLTIFHTRYNGGYEGGLYVALNVRYEEVPMSLTGDDVECVEAFATLGEEMPFGRGGTPDEALNNLLAEMERWEFRKEAERAGE